jgi:hypothetical integral membrane protein (TIGR02206 family)
VIAAEDSPGLLALWMRDFQPFSLQHLLSTGFFTVLGLLMIRAGRARLRRDTSGAAEASLRRSWGVFILLVQTIETIWWLLPENFTHAKSYPLALCDLAAWATGVSMLTGSRDLRVLVYYWGLCLSSQAFFTPILHEGEGWGTARFWFFYVIHTNIIFGAIYELVVCGLRPTWRDFWRSIVITMAYLSLVIPIDIALDVNYGFVGKTDEQPGVIALLPAWPWRIYGVMAAGFVAFLIATVPWWIVAKVRERRARGVPQGH